MKIIGQIEQRSKLCIPLIIENQNKNNWQVGLRCHQTTHKLTSQGRYTSDMNGKDMPSNR